MSFDVPESSLTVEELARIANFRRELADALDNALATGGGPIDPDDIPDGAVGLTKLAGVAPARLLGRATEGIGAPEALSGAQAAALLPLASRSSPGMLPTLSGVATDTLHGDGTWGPPGLSDTRDIFNVVNYGADVAGVSDATTAVRNAMAAAVANVAATGRRSFVYFPAGDYSFRGKSSIRHFDIDGCTKLSFIGEPGGRSRLHLNGNAALGDWYLFNVRGGSSDIEFRHLYIDMVGITNPDPAEQNHCIQVGSSSGGCSDVRVIDCEFGYTVGEGVRLVGEFGSVTRDVTIRNNRFMLCSRAGVSFQRWVQRVAVVGNEFQNGTDQQIDFEPTGYTLTCASGASATTVKIASGSFITWGIQAGDPIYNSTEDVYCRVVSVDSATQLTVTAGCTDWSGDSFYFPLHNSGHLIANNRLIRGTNPNDIVVTLTGTWGTQLVNNYIEGCIQGLDVCHTLVGGNQIRIQRNDTAGVRAIEFYKALTGLEVAHNQIFLSAITQSTVRIGIHLAYQVRGPHDVRVVGNTVRSACRAIGISLQGVKRSLCIGNTLILNTPGETNQSVGIYHLPVGGGGGNFPSHSAVCIGNDIYADNGQWLHGISFDTHFTNPGLYSSVACIGNTTRNCGTGLRLFDNANPGTFTNPPMLFANVCDEGSIVEPSTFTWIQVGGAVGGSAPTTNSRKPAMYWGTGTPEGVLTAGVGSIAMRRDGGAGSAMYVKESGTGNTGWVAK